MLNTEEVGGKWRLKGDAKAWEMAVPWAQLAYNASVHRSLSQQGDGLTPAEVYLGRQLKVRTLADAMGTMTSVSVAPGQYAAQVKAEQEKTVKWVAECRKKYNADMEASANEKGRKERVFEEGGTAWVRKPVDGSKKKRKLERPVERPFEVISRDGDFEYTLQKVGEGVRTKQKVHADRMGLHHNEAELAIPAHVARSSLTCVRATSRPPAFILSQRSPHCFSDEPSWAIVHTCPTCLTSSLVM